MLNLIGDVSIGVCVSRVLLAVFAIVVLSIDSLRSHSGVNLGSFFRLRGLVVCREGDCGVVYGLS